MGRRDSVCSAVISGCPSETGGPASSGSNTCAGRDRGRGNGGKSEFFGRGTGFLWGAAVVPGAGAGSRWDYVGRHVRVSSSICGLTRARLMGEETVPAGPASPPTPSPWTRLDISLQECRSGGEGHQGGLVILTKLTSIRGHFSPPVPVASAFRALVILADRQRRLDPDCFTLWSDFISLNFEICESETF